MKKILFIVSLFFVPFLSNAQTIKPIDGFLGIKFGASKESVIAALKAKEGNLINDITEKELKFENVKLGNRLSIQLSVVFVDNKAYLANFYFKTENDPETIDYYNSLVKDISDIYGPGKPFRIFKYPYKDGDPEELQAIQGGYANFFTSWKADNKAIEVSITSKLYVILIYEDGTLSAEAKAQEKAKQKADF